MNDYQQQWQEEMERALSILRQTELAETIKWSSPVLNKHQLVLNQQMHCKI